jgi:DNA-directed RNA polymerase specialized sigma24 family protein
MERSDRELLAATAAGDADAFGALFRRHEASVTRYAVRRCSNPSEVADAVAETFLAALRSAHRYRGESADALPWLFGIARNVVAQQVRAERRWVGLRHRARATRNDGLIWPHYDGLKWPHLVRSSADDASLFRARIGVAESGFQGGAVRADQA